MDFTLYWFMFPIAIMVATMAMLSGIGGTALFMPIFLLLFPALGHQYQLTDPVTAIAAALLTSSFGFISGYIGYYRKGLIDFKQGYLFVWISIPFAIIGVLVAHLISAEALRLFYGALLFLLAYLMIMGFTISAGGKNSTDIPGTIKDYTYFIYRPKKLLTALGGLLTGMLSTGIGEVVMPQLVKDGKLPVGVAAASSVLVVMVTMIIASLAHIITLVNNEGFEAVPWHLVCYTIPGVVIGGQLGPALQGRIPRRVMTTAIGLLFVFLGIGMLKTTLF